MAHSELEAFRKFFAYSLSLSDGPSAAQVEDLALRRSMLKSLCRDSRTEAQLYCGFLQYLGIGLPRAPVSAARQFLTTLRHIEPRPFQHDLFLSHEAKLYLAAHGCILAAALQHLKGHADLKLLLQQFRSLSSFIRACLGPNWIYKDICNYMLQALEKFETHLTETETLLMQELSTTKGILGGPVMYPYVKIEEDDATAPLPTVNADFSTKYRGIVDEPSKSLAGSSTRNERDQEDTSTDLSVFSE